MRRVRERVAPGTIGAMPSDRPVRVGVQLQPQHATFAQLRDAALRAEDLGVDVVFVWDHFYPLNGDPEGAHFECYTTLAALAEATERVELGALVTCNPYRNPNLLADMSRTIDHVSGGRFVLGIGSGWFRRDFDEYGYPFGEVRDRVASLRAALPTIRERFEKLNPRPVRTPLPILIAGRGERVMLRLVAQHAQIWHAFSDPEEFRHKCDVIDAHCAELGRDPREIERSCSTRDASPELLDRYVEAGATLVVNGSSGPDYDLSLVERLVAWRDARGG
jgi:probable F420-dependent oxidoreductase